MAVETVGDELPNGASAVAFNRKGALSLCCPRPPLRPGMSNGCPVPRDASSYSAAEIATVSIRARVPGSRVVG